MLSAGLLLTVACSHSAKQAVTVTDQHFAPQPPQVGPLTVSFHLNHAAKTVTGAHVTLEADMTHAGMAPVLSDAHEVAPGQYQGQLTLTMGGDWVVLMHITLPDGHSVEEQMNVSGVQSK